jgi:hypothetical protein
MKSFSREEGSIGDVEMDGVAECFDVLIDEDVNSTLSHYFAEHANIQKLKKKIDQINGKIKVKEDIDLKSKCLDILRGLQTHKNGWVFAAPVDPMELGLDDYFEIVEKPMDLGTIQKKLETGTCHSLGHFKSDVRLTFENAMKYNKEGTFVHEMAKELKRKFEDDLKKSTKQLNRERIENSEDVRKMLEDAKDERDAALDQLSRVEGGDAKLVGQGK